jgi:triphosphoribosyl-dephospho-CoA synthase
LTRKLQPRAAAATIARAFEQACLAELEALKPGNVHRHGDGHGMRVADFEASAKAAAPLIGRAKLGLGARIRLAVEATQEATGLNTNLGIVLLCAPLAAAAREPGDGDLQARLARVLAGLTTEDASEAYRAIRAARPGGLGEASAHDVAAEPSVTLLEAMRVAETRDRIAWNYTNDFIDVFDMGLVWLKQARERWGNGPWDATRVYIGFLAHVPDTLIERKFGEREAATVAEEARPIEASFAEAAAPEDMTAPLLAFDRSLKERGFNPGTSADLTVATLFAAALQELEKA